MEFPKEAAISFAYNRKHITEDLGHPGNVFFHLKYLAVSYGVLLLFIPIGAFFMFKRPETDKLLTKAFYAMVIVVFGFFSVFVATKMPALVYPVASILLITISLGIISLLNKIVSYTGLRHHKLLYYSCILLCGFIFIKPDRIIQHRSVHNTERNNHIHNTNIYKNVSVPETEKSIVFNCRPYENIELMFFRKLTAYHWYPDEKTIDSLQQEGYKIYAFQYEDNQALPAYFTEDKEVKIIQERLN